MMSAPRMRILVRVSGDPSHTAVARYGVKPTNQASAFSCVVPVLPAATCFFSRAFLPVPPVTFLANTAEASRAVCTENTRVPGSACWNSTLPFESVIFSM